MIETTYFWSIILALCVGTFAIRFSFIAFSARVRITDRMKEIFSFVPVAVIPALIAPSVFFHQGQTQLLAGKERFLVLVMATIVCGLTRSTLATISFGIAALWLVHRVLH